MRAGPEPLGMSTKTSALVVAAIRLDDLPSRSTSRRRRAMTATSDEQEEQPLNPPHHSTRWSSRRPVLAHGRSCSVGYRDSPAG